MVAVVTLVYGPDQVVIADAVPNVKTAARNKVVNILIVENLLLYLDTAYLYEAETPVAGPSAPPTPIIMMIGNRLSVLKIMAASWWAIRRRR
jgi:hypothetical protein